MALHSSTSPFGIRKPNTQLDILSRRKVNRLIDATNITRDYGLQNVDTIIKGEEISISFRRERENYTPYDLSRG